MKFELIIMINLIYRTLQIADMQQDIKATLIGSMNNILKKNETIIDVNHLWVLSFPNVIPYPIRKKQEALEKIMNITKAF